MNDGIVLKLPFTRPFAITWLCGFGPTLGKMLAAGLVPPGAGCEWQAPQESRLNRGPRPGLSPVTVWCSLNCANPVWKKAKSLGLAVTEANGCPALTPVLLRTPGSLCAKAIPRKNSTPSVKGNTTLAVLIKIPPSWRVYLLLPPGYRPPPKPKSGRGSVGIGKDPRRSGAEAQRSAGDFSRSGVE